MAHDHAATAHADRGILGHVHPVRPGPDNGKAVDRGRRPVRQDGASAAGLGHRPNREKVPVPRGQPRPVGLIDAGTPRDPHLDAAGRPRCVPLARFFEGVQIAYEDEPVGGCPELMIGDTRTAPHPVSAFRGNGAPPAAVREGAPFGFVPSRKVGADSTRTIADQRGQSRRAGGGRRRRERRRAAPFRMRPFGSVSIRALSVLFDRRDYYLRILTTVPAPTVRPPSRIAKRRPSSMAIGWIRLTVISVVSPGMTISVPSGREMTPVTSVVRK